MPALEQMDRHQKAVLREHTGSHDRYGEPELDDAVELRVRWVEKPSEMTDPNGNTIAVDAQVVLDREVSVNSIMWKGTLAAYNALGVGTSDEDDTIMRVVAVEITPDIRNRNVRHTAGLRRHRNTKPS